MVFFMFLTMNRLIFFFLAIPVAGLSAALAFVRISDVPLINYILYWLGYLFNPKQYVFKKEEKSDMQEIGVEKEIIISDRKNK